MPRNRRREYEDEDEDEMEMEEVNSEDAMDQEGQQEQTIEEELALKLVRYALSCEYSRTPIKRQGIREKILSEHPRAFKKVFVQAQKQLKAVYGLEMQELPVREKLTLEEKRRAMQNQSSGKSSETWILVNTLPKELRSPPVVVATKAPTAEREATYIGFYSMIICIIALSGGEITEQQLNRHLTRANADSMLGDRKTEDVISTLERQGYIVKKTEQISVAEDKSVSYLVGPRGKVEVGNQGVANIVRTVWGGSTPELEMKIAASLGIQPEEVQDEEEEEQEGQQEEEEVEEPPARDTRRRSNRRLTRGNRNDSD